MRNLSPALLERIAAVDGCRGRWIVDTRAVDGDYSYALRSLGDPWPTLEGGYWCQWTEAKEPKGGYRHDTPEAAALYCAATGWRCRLLWCSDFLREDCSWPGGYSPSAVYRSNARVFRDTFAAELVRADGDGPDVSLDVRFITPEMLETLQALEDYPLISEDDHSALELEDQQEAWDSWAARDWRRLVCAALDAVLPDDFPFDGDDLLSRLAGEDDKLRELFEACRESANEYWEEDGEAGQWVDLERVAGALTFEDLRDLTGLPLVDPAQLEREAQWEDQQRWRQEPYPWPGAEPLPLEVPCHG